MLCYYSYVHFTSVPVRKMFYFEHCTKKKKKVSCWMDEWNRNTEYKLKSIYQFLFERSNIKIEFCMTDLLIVQIKVRGNQFDTTLKNFQLIDNINGEINITIQMDIYRWSVKWFSNEYICFTLNNIFNIILPCLFLSLNNLNVICAFYYKETWVV